MAPGALVLEEEEEAVRAAAPGKASGEACFISEPLLWPLRPHSLSP